jgi:hypothetical protein
MITTIISFLATSIGRYVVIAVGIVGLIGAFSLREQNKGAAKLAAKIEANNATVTKKAESAARRSLDPAASRVLNPNYRD